MYQSFAIGRKIHSKENTDRRINGEIQNLIMGVCMRRPKADTKSKGRSKAIPVHFAPKDQVFSSVDFKRRTDSFYRKFAADSLENDIEKELR